METAEPPPRAWSDKQSSRGDRQIYNEPGLNPVSETEGVTVLGKISHFDKVTSDKSRELQITATEASQPKAWERSAGETMTQEVRQGQSTLRSAIIRPAEVMSQQAERPSNHGRTEGQVE